MLARVLLIRFRCGFTVQLALLAFLVVPAVLVSQVAQAEPPYEGPDRVEEWEGKRVLVVTPHPDDETFTSGGTLALMADRGNEIHVVVYTTDNAGSRDPEMTHERLAAIRKAEEENACKILGIPIEKHHLASATTTVCWSTWIVASSRSRWLVRSGASSRTCSSPWIPVHPTFSTTRATIAQER